MSLKLSYSCVSCSFICSYLNILNLRTQITVACMWQHQRGNTVLLFLVEDIISICNSCPVLYVTLYKSHITIVIVDLHVTDGWLTTHWCYRSWQCSQDDSGIWIHLQYNRSLQVPIGIDSALRPLIPVGTIGHSDKESRDIVLRLEIGRYAVHIGRRISATSELKWTLENR